MMTHGAGSEPFIRLLLGVTQYFTIKYLQPSMEIYLTRLSSSAGREAPHSATVAVIGSGYG